MRPDAEWYGKITIGVKDPRITPMGALLRKYKLDELPQLINVLFGSMSMVGPRPEVPEYVEMYDEIQRNVLNVKPGITDYASIVFFDENDLLGKSDKPIELYVKKIMPAKLTLNLKYIEEQSFKKDVGIIVKTIRKIVGK